MSWCVFLSYHFFPSSLLCALFGLHSPLCQKGTQLVVSLFAAILITRILMSWCVSLPLLSYHFFASSFCALYGSFLSAKKGPPHSLLFSSQCFYELVSSIISFLPHFYVLYRTCLLLFAKKRHNSLSTFSHKASYELVVSALLSLIRLPPLSLLSCKENEFLYP